MGTRPPKSRSGGALGGKAPRAARRRAVAPADVPFGEPTPLHGADLLKAGLKALEDLRGAAATRHSRFFEALLGIDPVRRRQAKELFSLPTLPTFEDVFDERVLRSLERLGIVKALAELREQTAALDQRLQRLEHGGLSRASRSKR